ncbi:13186_t:CDS:2, partial [Cetraspora pellucida]
MLEYTNCNILVLTYVWIFMNISTASAYKCMFKAVMETISELCQQEVQIRHIHNNSWRVILGDLNIDQVKSLGLALVNLDQTKNWKTQLTYIFKSCRVHYKRNIFKLKLSSDLKNLIYEILVADKEHVDAIFQEFSKSNEDDVL